MKKFMILSLSILISISALAGSDLRKDSKSRKNAGDAAKYIMAQRHKAPKGSSEKALDELKDICTKQLHRGCYFWEKGSSIMFQPLDNKGQKDGKIYDLKSWLKRLF